MRARNNSLLPVTAEMYRPYRVRKQRGEGYVDRETKARRQARKAVREFGRGEREVL